MAGGSLLELRRFSIFKKLVVLSFTHVPIVGIQHRAARLQKCDGTWTSHAS
jgi:hypothetical protein